MDWLRPEIVVGFFTLLALEIVLGIDNLVFISILAGKLPANQQNKGRQVGLSLALITRIMLLLAISWMIRLTAPLFSALGNDISGRDIILIVGGLFLIGKSTFEIHDRIEGEEGHDRPSKAVSFAGVVIQIMLLDVVFSLDSVITAVGMVNDLPVMIAAVVAAVMIMLLASRAVADFVNGHPTIKMLALSFLLLIGLALVMDGLDHHIPKGYIYFAMGFSLLVEVLNMRARSKSHKRVDRTVRREKETVKAAS